MLKSNNIIFGHENETFKLGDYSVKYTLNLFIFVRNCVFCLFFINFSDLDQTDISSQAAELVMNFPNRVNEFCDCVKKISKLICVQLSDKLEAENIDESDSFNERISFLSASDTE